MYMFIQIKKDKTKINSILSKLPLMQSLKQTISANLFPAVFGVVLYKAFISIPYLLNPLSTNGIFYKTCYG